MVHVVAEAHSFRQQASDVWSSFRVRGKQRKALARLASAALLGQAHHLASHTTWQATLGEQLSTRRRVGTYYITTINFIFLVYCWTGARISASLMGDLCHQVNPFARTP